MRNRIRKWALLAGAGLATFPASAIAQSSPPAIYKIWRGSSSLHSHGLYIDQMIAEFVAKNHLPGISMAIVQAPYVPRSAGYGRTNLSNDELASTKTMWNIGPITQAFTAVAVFQLKEAHRLDVHDPVGKYVPSAPASWAKISILDLLRHSSGIPDFREAGSAAPAQMKPADIVASVGRKPLLFKPGTEVRQSATDFVLLGLVIEAASQMSFHDYITRNQIEPIGLTSTMFTSDLAPKSVLDRPAPSPGETPHVRFKSQVSFINPVEPATGYRDTAGGMTPVDEDAAEPLFAFGDLSERGPFLLLEQLSSTFW